MPFVNVSPHLSMAEVACHDGTPYPAGWIQPRLIPLAHAFERIREICGFPLVVSSGYRTVEYNKLLDKSAKFSQHCEGRALDLHPQGQLSILQAAARQARTEGLVVGIGLYEDFVHVDTRPGVAVTWYGSRTNDQNQVRNA